MILNLMGPSVPWSPVSTFTLKEFNFGMIYYLEIRIDAGRVIGFIQNRSHHWHSFTKRAMDSLFESQVRGATALTTATHLDGHSVSLDALQGDMTAVASDSWIDLRINILLDFPREWILPKVFPQ